MEISEQVLNIMIHDGGLAISKSAWENGLAPSLTGRLMFYMLTSYRDFNKGVRFGLSDLDNVPPKQHRGRMSDQDKIVQVLLSKGAREFTHERTRPEGHRYLEVTVNTGSSRAIEKYEIGPKGGVYCLFGNRRQPRRAMAKSLLIEYDSVQTQQR